MWLDQQIHLCYFFRTMTRYSLSILQCSIKFVRKLKVDIHMTPDVMFNLQYIKICVYEEELTAASFKLNSNKTCILSIVLQSAG